MKQDIAEHVGDALVGLLGTTDALVSIRSLAALVGDADVQAKVKRRTNRAVRAIAKALDDCLAHIIAPGNIRTNQFDRKMIETQRRAIDKFLGDYQEREPT